MRDGEKLVKMEARSGEKERKKSEWRAKKQIREEVQN